jgi:uncharacterized protein YxeA
MDKRKKIIIYIISIIVVVAIVVGVIVVTNNSDILSYEYRDYYVPGETYNITLNKKTKKLHGEFYHASSALGENGRKYKYTVTLTNEEYENIMKLWNDKETISPILESICEDDKIMYQSFENSYEENKEEYDQMDSNGDGKITSREFANKWLKGAIEEMDN